jgi:hypothetical protein
LNLRPPVPQTGALTGLRYAPLSCTLMRYGWHVKVCHRLRCEAGARFLAGAGFESAKLIRSFMILLALNTITLRGVIGTASPVNLFENEFHKLCCLVSR